MAGETIDDRPSQEALSKCVHCGFCLQECPTYLQLGLETDSPRGRIHMIEALTDDKISATPTLTQHLDLCLQCRACETACPSGVEFGSIMESARAMIVQSGEAPWSWKIRTRLLAALLPYPKRIAALFIGLRLYQRTGMQWLVRASRVLRLLPGGLAEAESMLPELPARRFEMPSGDGDAYDRTVALLTGCVMPHLYPRTHEATVRVLERNGIGVVAPPEQRCCGALSLHAGDRLTARDLARLNVDVFLASGVEAVIVNSAGCGATMKEYGELLAADPAYAEKAVRFSSMVRDVTEFLAELPIQPPERGVEQRVTYQDSCHLVHGQRVRSAPRTLLRSIPGLELVELEGADRCCGSAGIYSFAQREMSLRLLDEKMRDVASALDLRTGRWPDTGNAPVIATANPGCMMQLEAGLRRHRLPGRVVHVVELLDEAYGAAGG
ncbi:MAG: 4Fe-4S dicluster domain-containing protein [Chloroflexi bacterium]|nr:4Fe-4S dicluster domain-containing protein [Chloroflexota bacterium]